MSGSKGRGGGERRSSRVAVGSPEEILERIARMKDPEKSSEPFDSEQTLARLIAESRAALRPRVRSRSRMYAKESAGFRRVMLLIQIASTDELRTFAMDIVDLLWGTGSASSLRDPRRLDSEKEWDVGTIEEVAAALARRSFYPFTDSHSAEGDLAQGPPLRQRLLNHGE